MSANRGEKDENEKKKEKEETKKKKKRKAHAMSVKINEIPFNYRLLDLFLHIAGVNELFVRSARSNYSANWKSSTYIHIYIYIYRCAPGGISYSQRRQASMRPRAGISKWNSCRAKFRADWYAPKGIINGDASNSAWRRRDGK